MPPKVILRSLCWCPLSHVSTRGLGKTHDWPKEPFSGDHGKLLARVPAQSPLEPLAGGLHMRQCTVQLVDLPSQSLAPNRQYGDTVTCLPAHNEQSLSRL